MIDLKGKRALVVGVANDQSIAWAVAQALRNGGAEIAVTYLNEKAEPHVRPLAESINSSIIMQLDVTRDEHEEPSSARSTRSGAASRSSFIRSPLHPGPICTGA